MRIQRVQHNTISKAYGVASLRAQELDICSRMKPEGRKEGQINMFRDIPPCAWDIFCAFWLKSGYSGRFIGHCGEPINQQGPHTSKYKMRARFTHSVRAAASLQANHLFDSLWKGGDRFGPMKACRALQSPLYTGRELIKVLHCYVVEDRFFREVPFRVVEDVLDGV